MDAIAKAHAARQAGEQIAVIAPLRHARGKFAVQAFFLAVEDEVHHPCDRIRPIGGRCAPGHDIDAAQQGGRDQVGIDRTLHGAGHETLAIDQDECALGIEPAQIEQPSADIAAQIGLRRRTARRAEAGQLVQRFADIGDAQRIEPFSADRGDRRRRVEIGTQARARHDDVSHGQGTRCAFGRLGIDGLRGGSWISRGGLLCGHTGRQRQRYPHHGQDTRVCAHALGAQSHLHFPLLAFCCGLCTIYVS